MWLLAVGLVALVAGIPPFAVSMANVTSSSPVYVWPCITLVIWIAASSLPLRVWNDFWLKRRGRLLADHDELRLDGRLVVGRKALRHGHVVHRGGKVFVRLSGMFRIVEVEVENVTEANRLLAAMRLDAESSVGHYPMTAGTFRRSMIELAIFVVVWVPSFFIALIGVARAVHSFDAILPVAGAWMTATLLWSARQFLRVSVGADRLRIRRGFLFSRYVPYGSIASTKSDGRDVTLHLRDGTAITMHHPVGKGWKPLLFHDRQDDARRLVERIDALISRHRLGGPEHPRLARDDRSTRDWLRDVTLASDEHASFRTPAIPPDELWRVVEDPVAAATARGGAALALRARLDDAGRARLRVVADACAAPRLRTALQTVASPSDDEALEETFDDLHDEPRALRSARV